MQQMEIDIISLIEVNLASLRDSLNRNDILNAYKDSRMIARLARDLVIYTGAQQIAITKINQAAKLIQESGHGEELQKYNNMVRGWTK